MILDGQPGESYECASCHGIFERTITDDEAIAEMRETWQPHPGDDKTEIVCDDCYQKIIRRARAEAPEVLR